MQYYKRTTGVGLARFRGGSSHRTLSSVGRHFSSNALLPSTKFSSIPTSESRGSPPRLTSNGRFSPTPPASTRRNSLILTSLTLLSLSRSVSALAHPGDRGPVKEPGVADPHAHVLH